MHFEPTTHMGWLGNFEIVLPRKRFPVFAPALLFIGKLLCLSNRNTPGVSTVTTVGVEYVYVCFLYQSIDQLVLIFLYLNIF